MKKLTITLLILFAARISYADSMLIEGFEYGNHDLEVPVGWTSDDNSWICGYLPKDHNRVAHNGNWYAFTNTSDAWMFMEMTMPDQLKYRFYFWAISDGNYDVEIWVGNGPSAEEMTQIVLSTNINSGEYERYSEYVTSLTSTFQYFGIHAIAHEGAYHLTIDDILIDKVDKYAMEVLPARMDTTMMPGSRVNFHYTVQNTGYEPLEIYMNPVNTEYFTDIVFHADGVQTNTFNTVANQIVNASCSATLRPEMEMGTLCWLDIMFTVSCDCTSTMATIWATVGMDGIGETEVKNSIYPNPSSGSIKIEGTGTLSITNLLGKEILRKEIIDNEIVTLEKGVYFVKINNVSQKVVIE